MMRKYVAWLFLGMAGLLCSCSGGDTPRPQDAAAEDSTTKVRELVVASFGGSFQEAQAKAFFKPFERETGIRLRVVAYDGSYEPIRSQVRSGRVSWDVVDVESAVLARGERDDLFIEIPPAVTEGIEMVPGSRTSYGVGADVFATVIGLRPGPEGGAPQTWSGFFDTAKYPGPRSLRRNPRGTLELALLADGVKPESLYPLDVSRAFGVLDRLRPDIAVWWTSGQQPIELLANGTVVATSVWSGRIFAARQAGESLHASFRQALLETEYWVVPRGSRNAALAQEFIRFTLRPDRQAEMSRLFGVAPTNLAAMDMVAPEVASLLPTTPDRLGDAVPFDPVWWANNEAQVQRRWEKWLAQ